MSATLNFCDDRIKEKATSPSGREFVYSKPIDINFDFNLCNRNARLVLSALGFDPHFEESNQISIGELIDACSRYENSDIASIVDNGKETVVMGNVHNIGIPAGYISEKIYTMKRLCIMAETKGATHAYFA